MMLVATSSFALHFSGRAAATLKGGRSTVKMATDLKMPSPLTQLEQARTSTASATASGHPTCHRHCHRTSTASATAGALSHATQP
tara:strand:+ start:236 stop:490 length:255 start_codon:yes stop_codon:yes gene_type:complete